ALRRAWARRCVSRHQRARPAEMERRYARASPDIAAPAWTSQTMRQAARTHAVSFPLPRRHENDFAHRLSVAEVPVSFGDLGHREGARDNGLHFLLGDQLKDFVERRAMHELRPRLASYIEPVNLEVLRENLLRRQRRQIAACSSVNHEPTSGRERGEAVQEHVTPHAFEYAVDADFVREPQHLADEILLQIVNKVISAEAPDEVELLVHRC